VGEEVKFYEWYELGGMWREDLELIIINITKVAKC
jgi:hypothetical protein